MIRALVRLMPRRTYGTIDGPVAISVVISMSVNRAVAHLAGFVAIVSLFTPGPSMARAADPESRCEVDQIRASSALYRCLIEVGTSELPADTADRLTTHCVDRHIARYAIAERHWGAACSERDELRTRQAVAAQAQALVDGSVSPMACADVTDNTEAGLVTCRLTVPSQSTTVSSVDLGAILNQLAVFGVSDANVMWIQAWGADGGSGYDTSEGGGAAGGGGFAQTITTASDFMHGFETSIFYFYLGQNGTHNSESGGQGGAATLVTTQDLLPDPTSDPDPTHVVAIAGGGGGGGGANPSFDCGNQGEAGAGGGVAFASTTSPGSGKGGDSSGGSAPGLGGNAGQGGAGANNGHDGYGGRGGDGGKSGLHQTGWINTGTTTLTFSAGEGAAGTDLENTSCVGGGGGGGGGWGGGGGGAYSHDEATGTEHHSSGGGGGASFSVTSTQLDGRAPDATTGAPTNPNGVSGFVQLVFDLAPDQ